MSSQTGQVAVITGAASGIGRGLAEEAARRGMRLVLADLDAPGLARVCDALRANATEVVSRVTDVGQLAQVEALRDCAVESFGGVDLLFNNAGVMQTGYSWEISQAQWQRMLDINLNGVIHGIRSFLPLLLRQGRGGHVINTASLAGLLSSPLLAPYNVTKQAVVALSETLHYELALLGAPIAVSVICPGPVASAIMGSNQHSDAAGDGLSQLLDGRIREGMSPAELATLVFDAIDAKRFWVLPHKDFKEALQRRVRSILDETNPQFRMPDTEGADHVS
ncbi:NAD(P)-dependent dehydrogenase (short-subunit alcohol dehydrogenase family) [Pseudomonas protegens]|uniref:SDR family NAD(P)-dependent oxidoreductase n=1 Tax=Pseudomonas TaxID=286 RepID=UPI0008882A12|nr:MULTISPECIES: SDR family NAD(P)-dependent oxidoreductase [Pseudomonas]MCU1765991.1 SDR family NAD(P)-dependent oxidoreductase [Pseudomonas protegens]URN86609.1 MAG: SDR family NAD(P)-dependent oxidoreductase [Pseudomonas protegens]WEK24693.1 MAG: SDR family NAD(P)-dependent oxidoreductase [Pseudomonas protegens]SDA34825.1 NADP-dependent 3-hydroxy acid dehydrogenase YdfG [Pseudomonas sp. NFPP12]SEM67222.1 NADP-dependent 3-hydroxy acid dehydrogenase YdfG [Pseudomonas sp. NFPP10]